MVQGNPSDAESGRPKEIPVQQVPPPEGPFGATADIPPLLVYRDRLQFFAGGRSVQIPLELLVATEHPNAMALLLYASVLKLRDIDESLRELAGAARESKQRVEEASASLTSAGIIGEVFEKLREMGALPPLPPKPDGPPAEEVKKGGE